MKKIYQKPEVEITKQILQPLLAAVSGNIIEGGSGTIEHEGESSDSTDFARQSFGWMWDD